MIQQHLHSVAIDDERLENFAPKEGIGDANVGPNSIPVPVEPGKGYLSILLQDVSHRDHLSVEHRGRPQNEDGTVKVTAKDGQGRHQPGRQLGEEHVLILLSFLLDLGQDSSGVEARLCAQGAILIEAFRRR